MKKFAALVSMLALLCLCAACDSGDSSSSDGSNTEPNTVTSTVTVTDWVSTEPVEGATLCVDVEGMDCVDTDAEGMATFTGELTVGATVQMTGDKEGYFPFLTEIVVADATANATAGYVMAPTTIVNVVIEALGEEPNADKGHLGVVAWGPADADGNRVQMAGATMTLLLGTATQGPKYYNLLDNIGDGVFAPDEGGTTEAGMASSSRTRWDPPGTWISRPRPMGLRSLTESPSPNSVGPMRAPYSVQRIALVSTQR